MHALHARSVRTGFCDVPQYITDKCGYKSYQQDATDESYYNTHTTHTVHVYCIKSVLRTYINRHSD